MVNGSPHYLIPEWPLPTHVRAAITLRCGGSSQPPFDTFNLADHVGDDPSAVFANRQALMESLDLHSQPIWLHQVHGVDIVSAGEAQQRPSADACITDKQGQPCVVLTADCLPVLLCNQQGTQVAAAHAGWRGLCGGILRNTVKQFRSTDRLLAYLGPAIGPQVFVVGSEVRQAFLDRAQSHWHSRAIRSALIAVEKGRYLADLYALARAELACCGVQAVFGGNHCTYSEPDRFYSYRRDHTTGRQASLIWLQHSE